MFVHNIKKLSIKNIIKYEIFALLIIIILVFCVHTLFFFNHEEIPVLNSKHDMNFVKFILINNLIVLIANYLGFIFSPMLILLNWGVQIFNIAFFISVRGLISTFLTLMPYSIIEIPTIILFQILSFNMFLIFFKYKNLMKVTEFVFINRTWYIMTLAGTVLGAFLEGLIKL